MRCDELKAKLLAGEPQTDETRGHLESCAACGEEFGFLAALRSARAVPPEGLRERVLAGAAPEVRGHGMGRVAAAAAVLFAAGAGFAGGWKARPVPEQALVEPVVVVKEVVREVEKPVGADLLACVAIAGQAIYRDKVKTTFNDQIQPTEISVDPAVFEVTMCPVARTTKRLCEERPDVFSVRK